MKKQIKKLTLTAATFAFGLAAVAGLSLSAPKATAETTIGNVQVDLSSFATYYGAEIRTNADDPGMRFTTGIAQSEYEKLAAIDGVSFGTIAVPADLLASGVELTHETAANAGVTPWETQAKKFITDQESVQKEGNVEFNGVITGIRDYNINRTYRSRAYVKYQPQEGEPVYYYAGYYTDEENTVLADTTAYSNARSVASVAYKALGEEENATIQVKQVYNQFVGFRPNATTENFERTFEDVRAFGVYAEDGTTAQVLTENPLNGERSLALSADGEAKASFRMPVLANLGKGVLAFKASGEVTLTDLDGEALALTSEEKDGYILYALTAEATAAVKADYGFILSATEDVVLDDFALAFDTVETDGKTTLGEVLTEQFDGLNATFTGLQQVLTSGNQTVDENTVLQKGATYTVTAKISAGGYNDGTVTCLYYGNDEFVNGTDAGYIGALAPNATVQNDGSTVTVADGATRIARAPHGFVVEEDGTDEYLKVEITKNGTASVFAFNSLDVSGLDGLRVRFKALLSDSFTAASWGNVHVSVNGVDAGLLFGQPKDGWVEVTLPKSGYASALKDGKFVETVAFYSVSGGVTSTFLIDSIAFADDFAYDFSKATALPSFVDGTIASLETFGGTQALKVTIGNGATRPITGLNLTLSAGQKIAMEVLACENNEGSGTTKIAFQYWLGSGNNNVYLMDLIPVDAGETTKSSLYSYTVKGTESNLNLKGIQFYPTGSNHNATIYIKSIGVFDESVSFDKETGKTTTLDFSQYTSGTTFTNVLGSVQTLNGVNMLRVDLTNNSQTAILSFLEGEALKEGDVVTIEFATADTGFNVYLGDTQIGYSGGTKDTTIEATVAAGTTYDSVKINRYGSGASTLGYTWIKSITVERAA